jgi:hypothetical protein
MFETKLEKEMRYRKYDPEYIKLTTLANMKLLPDNGDQFDFRGGIGNKILKQIKNEDGKYFERDNPQEEWKLYDLSGLLKRVLSILR